MGSICVPMGLYGVSMGPCGFLWGLYGSLRVSMGYVWVSMGTYGLYGVSMGPCGSLWVSMGPCGSLWGLYGSLWAEDLPSPRRLQEVAVPLMAQAQCRRLYGTEMGASRPPRRVRDDMICAGYPQGLRNTCKVRGGKGQRSGVRGHGVMGVWGYGVPMGSLWGTMGSL